MWWYFLCFHLLKSGMITMKLYSYVLRFDTGFAPNPFGKYCTLATYKPRIRKKAEPGDWVIGTGSAQTMGDKKFVYVMKVTEKLPFQSYWEDPRFTYKQPKMDHLDPRNHLDDIIYWSDANRTFHQEPSLHSNVDGSENEKMKVHDLNGQYILISDNFFYLGKPVFLYCLIPSRLNYPFCDVRNIFERFEQ